MPAQLTSTSIIFGDSTTLSSKYGIVGVGTNMVFFQAAAPTGWTKSVANNDAALRVVSGSGGVASPVSWNTNFSTAFPSVLTPVSGSATITATSPNGSNTTSSTTLTAAQIPIHSHAGTINADGGHVHGYQSFGSQPDLAGFSGPSGFDRTNPATSTYSTTTNNPHSHTTTVASEGQGGAHFHPWTFQSAPFSDQIDLRVQYCDLIICSFN
jgi:hypothetical protein